VESLDTQNHKNLYEITKLIKNEKSAVKIIAVIIDEPLSAEDIVEKCGLSAIQCHRLLRKLREIGLIKLVRSAQSEALPEQGTFLYQAQLSPDLIRFENGRFKMRFPSVLNLPGDERIDVKAFFNIKPES
jgi:transcription initiation factor IIE alpha subunit